MPNFVEWSLYIGLVPLALLGGLRLRGQGSGRTRLLLAFALGFLLIAFAVPPVIFPAWCLGFVLDPRRTLLVVSFLLCLLAALGLSRFLDRHAARKPSRSRYLLVAGVGLALLALGSVILASFGAPRLAAHLGEWLPRSETFAASKIPPFDAAAVASNAAHLASIFYRLALAAGSGRDRADPARPEAGTPRAGSGDRGHGPRPDDPQLAYPSPCSARTDSWPTIR